MLNKHIQFIFVVDEAHITINEHGEYCIVGSRTNKTNKKSKKYFSHFFLWKKEKEADFKHVFYEFRRNIQTINRTLPACTYKFTTL